jgi:HEAT repeat protein
VSLILDYPGAIQAEPSRGLSRALSRIMLDRERRDAIEPLLRAEAAQSGISENTYRNVVELLLSRHKEAAGSDRPQPRQWLGDEMVAMTHPNRSGERDPAFDQLLETTAPESVRRARIEMLLELLHADLEIGKYAAILELLAEEGRRGSEQGETDIALGILAGLQREGGRDVQEDAGRRAVVTSALARTGTASVVADVLSEIARAGPERKWELITLLGGLGDEGMSALVSLARQPETVDVGDVVASVVRRDGASFFWLRRLLTEATADVMPQIMRALLRLGNHRVTSQLSVLADHQSLSVKLELIEAICEAGPSAASVLERLLGDADYSVRLVAVHALGALRAVEAAPTLCKLLAEQPSFGEAARARESIVTALGEMRAESAIPALRDVLLWTGFAALLANVRPRVAAAAALGKIGGEAAREALTQGARSRLRAVREACRAALAGMGPESGERQRHDR